MIFAPFQPHARALRVRGLFLCSRDFVPSDQNTIKAHVAHDGSVWHLLGDAQPVSTSLSPRRYVHDLCAGRFKPWNWLRVVGCFGNSELLISLDDAFKRDAISGLEVCSPLVCPKAQYNVPEVVLYRMRQWDRRSPSQGGWHSFTELDRPGYEIAEVVGSGGDPTLAVYVLHQHPVWPYLSFIPHLNEFATATVVSFILDPRWYVDPLHPDRSAKLRAHLGLMNGSVNPDSSYGKTLMRRYDIVLDAWKHSQPSQDGLSDPGNFLWRAWATHGGNGPGDLKASKRFIDYLRFTWLDVIYKTSKQCDRLFDPELFFSTPDEAEAYRAHMKAAHNG